MTPSVVAAILTSAIIIGLIGMLAKRMFRRVADISITGLSCVKCGTVVPETVLTPDGDYLLRCAKCRSVLYGHLWATVSEDWPPFTTFSARVDGESHPFFSGSLEEGHSKLREKTGAGLTVVLENIA